MREIAITFADGEALQFPAIEGESVLVSAERAGIALAHNCRSGTCRTCIAKTTDGEILLCSTPAREGLKALVPYVRAELTSPTLRRAKVNGFCRISQSVWEVRYRLQFPLTFLPGQYIEALFPGMVNGRYFSMANAPLEKEQILLVRDLPGGAVSDYLTNRAQPNDPFSVRGPFGTFYLRSTPKPKLFVAGGTGLAPVLAMLRTMRTTSPNTPTAVVAGFRSPADICRLEHLYELSKTLQLEVCTTVLEASDPWRGHKGSSVDALANIRTVPFDGNTEAYLCGPPGMVTAARSRLVEAGLDGAKIFSEEFVHSGDLRPIE